MNVVGIKRIHYLNIFLEIGNREFGSAPGFSFD